MGTALCKIVLYFQVGSLQQSSLLIGGGVCLVFGFVVSLFWFSVISYSLSLICYCCVCQEVQTHRNVQLARCCCCCCYYYCNDKVFGASLQCGDIAYL
jgi:hypothetical protein